MSRELCKHGILLDRPCYDCQMDPVCGLAITAKDVRIATLEIQNQTLRSQLANAQQVAQFAQELMGMGDVAPAHLDIYPEGWMPIETAPKKGTIWGWDGRNQTAIYRGDGPSWWILCDGDYAEPTQFNATHWMPQPDPPEARPGPPASITAPPPLS